MVALKGTPLQSIVYQNLSRLSGKVESSQMALDLSDQTPCNLQIIVFIVITGSLIMPLGETECFM